MEHIYTVSEQLILNSRWLFDVEQDQLFDLECRAETVRLTPIAVRVLAILAHSPFIVLPRRKLLDDGWRSFGFEVCENSLNQVICSLRGTFEALPPGRPFIKTIPRIGYCLLADVRMNTAGCNADQQASEPDQDLDERTEMLQLECAA